MSITTNIDVMIDAHVMKIVQRFFEFDDKTMMCNDMLTKVFSLFSSSIANGRFEATLNEFLKFMPNNKSNKKRINSSEEITYYHFQMILAGLIMRFSDARTIQQVLNSNTVNGTADCALFEHDMRMNDRSMRMMNKALRSDMRLIPRAKIIVIEPKQALILIFLFNAYYSNNSGIEDSTVRAFMDIIDEIDETIMGTVKMGTGTAVQRNNDSVIEDLLTKYSDNHTSLREYIQGEYKKIFANLNECFWHWDFLNTNNDNNPRWKTKQILLCYITGFLGFSSLPDEYTIWSLLVNDFGAVTTLDSLILSGGLSKDMIDRIVTKSLLINGPLTQEVMVFFETRKYSTSNPYDKNVQRKNDDLLNINTDKLNKIMNLLQMLT
uniref:U23-like protein n=1 Tax=Glypta fumiferanae TaxID=389681 RepID=A0A0F6Q747_9HYME|nr:U23-like protein [Glypta fumiferanae]